jgi:prenyltransferase beta subunit
MNMNSNDINNQLQEIAKRYTELPYLKRLRNMMDGLGSPRSSRTYKESMIELQRLSAPVVAVFLPLLMVGILVVLSAAKKAEDRVFKDVVIDVETPPIELEPVKPLDKPLERETEVKVDVVIDQPDIEDLKPTEQPISPQPAPLDAVMITKSPLILKNLIGRTRDPGERGKLGKKYNNSPETEEAVNRTLRWLKKNQQPDGSWRNNRIAMTGLAILTYLSHGETPDKSKEFGETVQKGLEYLMSQQLENGHFKGSDGHEYSLPIATYALCEAYGMTLNPNVKQAAEKALSAIVNGQQASGGWDYNVKQTDRADTSYMGWCAQAVKAGYMAKLDVVGLDKSLKLAVRGFKRNASAEGGFGYTAPSGNHGMTSVGTLCMQLLGGADQQEVKRSMAVMDKWSPSFDEKAVAIGGQSLQYYFYYATQCRFHEGGTRWDTWNEIMKKVYVPAQKTLSKELSGYVDHLGKPQEIGWWENQDHHTDRPVMDSCLAALQLMVYYRNLKTTDVDATKVIDELRVATPDKDAIVVNTPNI